MRKDTGVLTGVDAWKDAKRKAVYGRNDWVAWIDKDWIRKAAKMTASTIKAAMLATGTQNCIYVYHAGDNHATILTWGLAALYWRNAKHREERLS